MDVASARPTTLGPRVKPEAEACMGDSNKDPKLNLIDVSKIFDEILTLKSSITKSNMHYDSESDSVVI